MKGMDATKAKQDKCAHMVEKHSTQQVAGRATMAMGFSVRWTEDGLSHLMGFAGSSVQAAVKLIAVIFDSLVVQEKRTTIWYDNFVL
jgi:hypothetical protein